MKGWIKKRFEQTPNRRISNAYWLGSFQMMIFMGFFQDMKGQEGYIEFLNNNWMEMHWAWWIAMWLVVAFLFVRNGLAFRRETLWMTIKNPMKVEREADDRGFPVSRPIAPPPPGSRPPPPPAPPPSRSGTSI